MFCKRLTHYEKRWIRSEHNKYLTRSATWDEESKTSRWVSSESWKSKLTVLALVLLFSITLLSWIYLMKFIFIAGSRIKLWMNLRFSPVYRGKAPVQDWCLDSVFIYTCAGEEKETGKPNETITQGMILAFELRLTIIFSGMLWSIVFSLQMADQHTKVKVKNLCYVTARHRRLNLTPMWTRCGLPTQQSDNWAIVFRQWPG